MSCLSLSLLLDRSSSRPHTPRPTLPISLSLPLLSVSLSLALCLSVSLSHSLSLSLPLSLSPTPHLSLSPTLSLSLSLPDSAPPPVLLGERVVSLPREEVGEEEEWIRGQPRHPGLVDFIHGVFCDGNGLRQRRRPLHRRQNDRK